MFTLSKRMVTTNTNKSITKNNNKMGSIQWIISRKFSGPQEPKDTRDPWDVDPDWWDARHWEKIVEDLEFEIAHYDDEWAIIGKDELEYDLYFAKRMYEWRKLEEPKYLTAKEAYDEGIVESAFGTVGFKMRAELDYRVIGGRGGVDTQQNFYDDAFIYGPFGTEDKPVLVPSRNRYRMVGCIGMSYEIYIVIY